MNYWGTFLFGLAAVLREAGLVVNTGETWPLLFTAESTTNERKVDLFPFDEAS